MTPVIDLVPGSKVNFKCYRGNTVSFILRFFDDAAKTIPTVLAGSKIYMDVKDVKTGTTKLSFTTEGASPSIVFQNTNEAKFDKSMTEMRIDYGIFSYDAIRVYSDGTTGKTPVYGTWEVTNNITTPA